MRKFILFLILITGIFSCKKDVNNAAPKSDPVLQPGDSSVTGYLSYACICVDGGGLTYATDDHRVLVFDYEDSVHNMSAYVDSLMNKNTDFLNVHSRLIFHNTGDSRCLTGIVGQCYYLSPIVQFRSLTKI